MNDFKVVRIHGKEKKCIGCLCATCQHNPIVLKQGKCDGCMYCFEQKIEPIRTENIEKCAFGYVHI